MALGMRNKFDIGQAIVQTAGYGLGAKLQKVPSLAVRDAIKAFGTTVLSSVISGHRLDLVQLAANFAGNYAQDKTAEIMQDHQRQEAERAIEQHQEAKQDARRTAVARQDRTTQEGREVAPTPSHRSQDEETTVPTTASRCRSFFGDDQETRSTLADASRATRAKAATSALATATTRHSGILTDISTDDAILDATREALSGTFATPDSQALVSLRGGEVPVARERTGNFGTIVTQGFRDPISWSGATTQEVGKFISDKYLPQFNARSADYGLRSRFFMTEAMSAPVEAKWGKYALSYSYAREAASAEFFANGMRAVGYLGSQGFGIGLNVFSGAIDLYQNPTERNAYRVVGGVIGATFADTVFGVPVSVAINAAAPVLTPFVTIPLAVTADVAINRVGWALGESYIGEPAYKAKMLLVNYTHDAVASIEDSMNRLSPRW